MTGPNQEGVSQEFLLFPSSISSDEVYRVPTSEHPRVNTCMQMVGNLPTTS